MKVDCWVCKATLQHFLKAACSQILNVGGGGGVGSLNACTVSMIIHSVTSLNV